MATRKQSDSDEAFSIKNVAIVDQSISGVERTAQSIDDDDNHKKKQKGGGRSSSSGSWRRQADSSSYEQQLLSQESLYQQQNYSAYAHQQQYLSSYQQQQQAAAYYGSYQSYTAQPGYPPQDYYGATNQYAPWPVPGGNVQNAPYIQQPPPPYPVSKQQQQQSNPAPPTPQPSAGRRGSGGGRSTSGSSPALGGSRQQPEPYYSSGGEDAYAALLQGTGRGGVVPATYGSVAQKKPPSQQIWTSQQVTENSSKLGLPPSRSSSQTNLMLPPPPPPPRQQQQHHRRSQSDSLAKKSHRRTSSDKLSGARRSSAAAKLRTDPLRNRKTFDHKRSNSMEPQSPSTTPRATHRRVSSAVSQVSAMSEASLVSHVTDIRRSTFFGGIDKETGYAQLYFPFENVHLVPLNREKAALPTLSMRRRSSASPLDGYPLRLGHLYRVPIDEEEFELYHRTAEDASSAWFDGSCDDFDAPAGEHRRCRCDCANCAACSRRAGGTLPTNYYCLAVEDNLYRRVVDEICASSSMPCGLFFCGHHEDVSRPSILLAVGTVTLLLGAMGLAAYVMQA